MAMTMEARMLTNPHVRLVWAKAPGVICLLPPRHQGDFDEVGQDDDYGQQGQSDVKT